MIKETPPPPAETTTDPAAAGVPPGAPAASPASPASPFTIAHPGREPVTVAGLGSSTLRPVLKEYAKRQASVAVEAGAEAVAREEQIFGKLGLARDPERAMAININHAHLDTPEAVHQLIDVVADELTPTMQKARRGTRTFEQIVDDARALGFTSREVEQWKPGHGWTAEKVTAARFVMADASSKLDVMAERIRAGEADDVTKARFREMLSKYAGIQAAVHGAAAEAGRTLSAFRISAQPGDIQLNQVKQLLDTESGTIDEVAAMWGSLPDDAAKGRLARAIQRPGALAILKELYMNSLLSGLTTQSVNVLSNALVTAYMPAERLLAGSLGWVRAGLTGGDKGVLPGEAAYEVLGYLHSLKDAFKLMAHTLRTEDVAGEALRYDASSLSAMDLLKGKKAVGGEDAAAKTDQSAHRAITGENVIGTGADMVNAVLRRQAINTDEVMGTGVAGAFFDVLGQFVRLPGRGMGAADQVFKTLAYRGTLYAEAYRDAIASGLTDRTDIAEHVLKYTSEPPEPAVLRGFNAARYRTFTDELESRMGKGAHTVAAGGAWVVMPFVRTPLNILSFSAERMGLRPMKIARELASDDAAVRDTAMAKVATGAAFWATAMATVAENYDCAQDRAICFTGAAPADPKLARAWRQDHQEYSLRVDGEWYSYSRLDPWGQMLGIAVDALQVMQLSEDGEYGDLPTAMTLAVANNIVNKTYMSGMADFLETFTSNDVKKMQKYLVRQTASASVPTFIANIERTKDPESRLIDREAGFLEQVMQQMKSRSPWHSAELAPRRNVWGEKVLWTTAMHANWISPIFTHKDRDDPVDNELLRLGVPINMPPRQLKGVPLTPHEWSRYIELAGNGYKMGPTDVWSTSEITAGAGDVLDLDGLGFKQALGRLIKTRSYKEASDSEDPPGGKVLMIRHLMRMYRERAGNALMAEYERLPAAAESAYSASLSERGSGGEGAVRGRVAGYRAEMTQAIQFAVGFGTPGHVQETE